MNQRKIHRVIGLFMLIPLLAWAVTGVIFLTKPGYSGAYERLYVKSYEMDSSVAVVSQKGWQEIRFLQTVLGLHVLAKREGEFKQYHYPTLLPADPPGELQVKALLAEAIQGNPERYGSIERVEGLKAFTSTGIEITLNWDDMTLTQRGIDRAVIETLYKIHYLQWTKWDGFNLMLGVFGLCFLFALTILGFGAYLSGRRQNTEPMDQPTAALTDVKNLS